MIRRTSNALRRIIWLDLAAGAALLLVVFGITCSKAGYGSTPGSAVQARRIAPPELLGMQTAGAPDMQVASAANQVTISNFSFGPGTLTVSAGTTVTWTNQDSITHTVTASDGSFDSSNLTPGQQFSYTFSTPGTHNYHCSIHPFMMGQVIVQ